MCTVKPVGNGGRKTTPSGIIFYEDTPEGHAAQAEDMAKTMGPGSGEGGQDAVGGNDTAPPPAAPDPKDCSTYTDALWDTACSKYFKFAQMKMKPVAQEGLTAAQIACNWQNLCKNILDPIIDGGLKLGKEFNSGFRTIAANKACGGSPTSDHLLGSAVDITMGSPEKNKILFKWIGKNINSVFSQVIYEGNWVHVAYKGRTIESNAVMATRTGKATYQNGGGRSGRALDPDLKWA